MKTWKTRDGRVLNIKDMETSHIINCIKMLEDDECVGKREVIDILSGPFPTGDMASLEFDRVIDQASEMYVCDELDWFKEELEKRGVNYE